MVGGRNFSKAAKGSAVASDKNKGEKDDGDDATKAETVRAAQEAARQLYEEQGAVTPEWGLMPPGGIQSRAMAAPRPGDHDRRDRRSPY
jgi:hypothetical protein